MIILDPLLLLDGSVNHPVICAYPMRGEIVASSAAPGFDAAFAADTSTIKFWRPTSLPATWQLTPDPDLSYLSQEDDGLVLQEDEGRIILSDGLVLSYVGLAAHDLAANGVTVAVQIPGGEGWQTLLSHSPEDNSPILFLLAAREIETVRLQFTGPDGLPTVGIIMMGEATVFPQQTSYVGRRDIFDGIEEEYSTTLSEGGNFIARYVTRKSQTFNLTVSHISEEWKRVQLDPLIEHLRGGVAFVADRPWRAPRSVGFGQLASRPVPERDLPNARISVTVSMDFIGHVS